MFGYGQDIGIDLGTASVLVYVRNRGIVLHEPSVVAIERSSKKVLAVGLAAQRMLGRTPGNIVAIRPLKDGVISDYDVTEKMLKHFLKKLCSKRLFKPRVIVCVPSGVTEVEKRAVIDATIQAGAAKACLIEEPIAAAIGAGIDISRPMGAMVVDIGGGTTDIAVISLGGTVVSDSIKIASDKFDDAIVRYIRKKYSMMIGERTAEQLKKEIGCVFPRPEEVSMEIKGRSLVSGLPQVVSVSSVELMEALEETVSAIVDATHNVLEKTPPELISDISDNGIILTGGGSLIYGLGQLLQNETGLDVRVASDAISCVAIGTGKALDNIEVLMSGPR